MIVSAALAQLTQNEAVSFGLLIVGIIFISAWLIMRARKRLRDGPNHTTATENLERYRQHEGVRGDLESLMVDIEQLAQRLGSQLDAKAVRLEKLIDDADLRLSQLRQADLDAHANAAPPRPEEVKPVGQAEPGSPADPLTADVYRLADIGKTASTIARELDEHVGKVELILALRQT
ncbi:MAG: hypothetical protein AAF800_04510 [Planctomycetota bacterium]